MAFEIARFSSDGLNLLAELTTSKSIKLKNVYVDTVEHSLEDIEEPVSWWATETAEAMQYISASISSAGKVNDNEARLTIQMKLANGDETQIAKTVVVTACSVESGIEGSEIVLCAVSDANGVEILYNDSGITVNTSIAIYFAFSNASSITVEGSSNPDYVIHSELDRFVSAHALGAPNIGENQTIRGDKLFNGTVVLDVGDTWEYSLKSGVVITKYAGDDQDDESLYQGRITANDTGLAIDVMNVNAYSDLVEFRDYIGEDEYNTVMRFTKLENDEYEVSIAAALSVDSGLRVDSSGITLYKSVMPDGNRVRLGDIGSYFRGVYTDHIDFGTGVIGSAGGGLLSMQGNLIPLTNSRYDLGSNSYRWQQIYTDSIRCTSQIILMAASNTRQLIFDATANTGDLTIAGFNIGTGLILSTGYADAKPSLTCGKIFGELVSPEYTSAEFPGEEEYTTPPAFNVEVGSIVMAIPCWATLRSIFGTRQPVGKIIDVVVPNNWQTAQPFEHTLDYENDPENGAWYYAVFRPGSSRNGTSAYKPLRTLTQGTGGGVSNYAYLTAGRYKLLSCVDAYDGYYEGGLEHEYTYGDYVSSGACMMLQRVY